MDTQTRTIVTTALLLPLLNDERIRNTPAYQARLAKLAADIAVRGIRNPIVVRREGKMYRVLSGETRRHAAILAGLNKVPVLILEGEMSEFDQDCETLLENLMREELSDAEKATRFVSMLEKHSLTPAELARRVPGLREVDICRFTKASRLPIDLRALMGKGPGKLGPSVSYQIGRLHSEKDMREVAEKYLKDLLDRDGVVNEVNRRLGLFIKGVKQKPVKATIGGVTFIFTDHDVRRAKGVISLVIDGLSKPEIEKDGIAALPGVLKAMNGESR